jgi:Yip1 domain
MSLIPDIIDSWRSPAKVLRQHLQRPQSEPFAFTFLVTFLLISFVGQWPNAARSAHLQPDKPLVQTLVATGLALLATIPLWYGLAALSRLLAKILGGKGSWYGARLALFWALVAISPAMLLQGLTAGFMGQGPQATALNIVIGLAFLTLWGLMLKEAERG